MLIGVSDTTLAAPRGARLAQGVVLLLWPGHLWPGPFRPMLGRAPLAPPLLGAVLAEGGMRLGLLRLPRRTPAHAALRLGPEEGAATIPLAGLAPEAGALAEELPATARASLLRLLLDAGTGLFGLAGEPGFRALVARLARAEAAAEEPMRPVATGPGQWRLLRGPAPDAPGPAFLVGPSRCLRLPIHTGAHLHALVEAPLPEEVLLGGGRALWARPLSAPEADPPPLLERLAAGGADAVALTALLPVALGDRPEAAELLRAASLLAPPRPRSRALVSAAVTGVLELALPDGAGGLFLRGWLRDPHGLVREMALAGPEGPRPLDGACLHRFPRRDLAPRFRRAPHAAGEAAEGFVAHLPDAGGLGRQPDLLLRLAGGGELRLTPGLRSLAPAAARDAVLAAVRPEAVTKAMLDEVLAPAAARLHARHLALPRTPVVQLLGPQPPSPEVSAVVPLYRNLAFLRPQVAALASDPGWRNVETIFVLDSPEQAAEVEHLLRGLVRMHGIGLVLAVPPRNLGYAAATNIGAGLARGRLLLLLNSDVVPDRPGWLRPLAAAARRGGVAGAKLLFDDGSIQHAGMYFARDPEGAWYNRHFHKGFPRRHPPAETPREVPAVTGAALMIRRALFEAVDGLTESYVVGDYEDSDLCLKARAAGARVLYAPEAELWHFERRSIALHQGYTGTLAAMLNRRQHARRWDGAMARLMARFAATTAR